MDLEQLARNPALQKQLMAGLDPTVLSILQNMLGVSAGNVTAADLAKITPEALASLKPDDQQKLREAVLQVGMKAVTGAWKEKISLAFNNNWIFGSTMVAAWILGLTLLVGGAIDVAKTGDNFSKTVEQGGTILAAHIHMDTGCGSLVVQYKVDGKTYQIQDIVTRPLLCLEREAWLEEYTEKIEDNWFLVRYNPSDPRDATLVEKGYSPVGLIFVVMGTVILAVAIGLTVYWFWKRRNHSHPPYPEDPMPRGQDVTSPTPRKDVDIYSSRSLSSSGPAGWQRETDPAFTPRQRIPSLTLPLTGRSSGVP